ncbi:MAG: Transcriptional regulator, CdaR-family, partial [uncultured Solirubrobacteraceae bacterium]
MSKTSRDQVVAGAQLPDRPWEGLPAGTAEVLRREASDLAPRITEAIRDGVAAYARPLTGAFGEQFLTGVQSALDQFAGLVEQPHGDALPSRELYRALGAAEARAGRSLEALLAAYRIGARVAWRHVARVAREAGLEADTLALLAESIFAYIDELSAQ